MRMAGGRRRTNGQVVFLQTGARTVQELDELVSRIKQQVMALLALMDPPFA